MCPPCIRTVAKLQFEAGRLAQAVPPSALPSPWLIMHADSSDVENREVINVLVVKLR